MNFGAPAQCNGTVTSWTYCSYNTFSQSCDGGDDDGDDSDGSDSDDGDGGDDNGGSSASYTSVFLVYRQTGASTYQLVPGSRKSVTLTLRCSNRRGFQCNRVETLSQSEQFTIQENDIVAACLKDTGSTNPIRLVGYQSSGPSNDVYQYNVNNYEDCTTTQLQSIDVQNTNFITNGGIYRLHLYAETNSKA